MTPSSYTLPRSLARPTLACVEEDQRRLAEHRSRCLDEGSGHRWDARLQALRGFTARHVVSVAALALTVAGGVRLLG